MVSSHHIWPVLPTSVRLQATVEQFKIGYKPESRKSSNALLIMMFSFAFSLMTVSTSAFARDHPRQITVNGKPYDWPKTPAVVVLIDGGDPAYVNAALQRNLLPNFKKFTSKGFASVAPAVMPGFTNNVSVITGGRPATHGISGNFFLAQRVRE